MSDANGVKEKIIGAMRARGANREPDGAPSAIDAAGASVESLVASAAHAGTDAPGAATEAVEGALHGAARVGVNALDAVSAAAGGAVRGAA